MALSIKHDFQSAKSDGPDSTLVQPSNWNAEHDITAGADKVLGTVGAGAVGEIACTAAGRALIGAADLAAQKTVLGLGTAASKDTGTSGNTVPLLDQNVTHSGDFTVTGALKAVKTAAGAQNLLVETTDDSASVGPVIDVVRNSANPAANDFLGAFRFYGKSSTAVTVQYGGIFTRIIDPTNGSMDFEWGFQAQVAGSLANVIWIGNGVKIGAATGGYMGDGTVNAVAYYQQGQPLSTVYQPLDVALTAIATVTPAANKLPYYTGASTAALADFTAAGRALAALPDAGANYLPYFWAPNALAYTILSAAGRAFAAAADAGADYLPYFSGVNTLTYTSISAFGRSLVAQTSQAAQRAALEILGAGAKQLLHAWAAITYSGGVSSLTDGVNIASLTDLGTGSLRITLAVAHTTSNPAAVVSPQAAGHVTVNVAVSAGIIDASFVDRASGAATTPTKVFFMSAGD